MWRENLVKEKIKRTKTPLQQIFFFIILLSFVISQCLVLSVNANRLTYYVSTSGSDSNTGSLLSPWRTIQKAANTVTSGDVVYIRGGTYREKVTLSNIQGTISAWITFKPYNNEAVIVDATGLSGDYDGIFQLKNGCSYIRISGIEMKSTISHGVFLNGAENNNIRIDHCVIHDCESSGIYVYSSDYIEFDNNTVYDVNNGLSYGTSLSPQEAISFSNVQGFEIHHNTLSKYGKEGIDVKSGSSGGSIHHNIIDTSLEYPSFHWDWNHVGIYIDGYNRKNYDIDVYCNKITGYGGAGILIGAEVTGGSIEKINIYNNVVSVSYVVGYADFRPFDSIVENPWKDVLIYGNTFYTESSNPSRIFPSASYITNLTIKNNIFSGKSYYLICFQYFSSTETLGKIVLANNLFYRFGGTGHNLWKDGTDKSWGINYILTDPKFVNINDFHLQSDSPAIDVGEINNAVSNDFDGMTRPQGNNADIGAYEYYEIISDTTPPLISTIELHSSTVLDTEIGWENISCTVNDDIAIHEVNLTITDPKQITTTISMLQKNGTSTYYYNLSLKQTGNYNYYIRASDIHKNKASSMNKEFSLPPNWDINNDGKNTIIDSVLISGHFGKKGTPGWIRADVDNNGIIDLFDIIQNLINYMKNW